VMCVMWIVDHEVGRVVPRANVRFVLFVYVVYITNYMRVIHGVSSWLLGLSLL